MMMPSIFGEDLFDDMLRWSVEDDFFGKHNPLYGKHAKNMMKTDVKEHDDSYEVEIDLPGFKKDEISAQLENGYLTVMASKGLDKDEKDKEGKYIRRERYSGSCSRSFYVGDNVKDTDVKASFKNGILTLEFPKEKHEEIEEKKIMDDELRARIVGAMEEFGLQ